MQKWDHLNDFETFSVILFIIVCKLVQNLLVSVNKNPSSTSPTVQLKAIEPSTFAWSGFLKWYNCMKAVLCH